MKEAADTRTHPARAHLANRLEACFRLSQRLNCLYCYVCVVSLVASSASGQALTRDQMLVVACYRADIDGVVENLRNGAAVDARIGDAAFTRRLFQDKWTGGETPIGAAGWTPLIALANSPVIPDPPDKDRELWVNPDVRNRIIAQVPPEALVARANHQNTILHILLSHKCDLDAADEYGATALFFAAAKGKAPMVASLLKCGANGNVRVARYIDGPGNLTPLHASSRNEEIAGLLLRHGANPELPDSEGRTPLVIVNEYSKSLFDIVWRDGDWIVQKRKK